MKHYKKNLEKKSEDEREAKEKMLSELKIAGRIASKETKEADKT